MAARNRFIIKRKDRDSGVDDVVIESEGLTLGRLIGNDLVLNHRSVSRTHAGLKQIGGDFWLFNLSSSNGTLLNGQLVERAPLADGDVVQIGAYLLLVNYVQTALSITVERELEVIPLEVRASASLTPGNLETGDATVMIRMQPAPTGQAPGSEGTKRPGATGLLTSVMPAIDEQALSVFWDKRKREAGKIDPRTPLHPRSNKKVGKAQFNWYPTLDLKRLWPKSYFSWAVLVIGSLAIMAGFAYQKAYSPGEIATVHQALDLSRNIAAKPNANSCSSCHGVGSSMQDGCSSCHSTQSFQPIVYDSHRRENVGCTECHTEHQGSRSEAGLIRYGLCSNCHNESYRIRTGERAGNVLGIPHGGSVGYPVEQGKWVWQGLSAEKWKSKNLPESWAKYAPTQQFHSLHQKGRLQGRTRCGDCHIPDVRSEEGLRKSPRAQCAKCHGLTYTDAVITLAANCGTCHQQHGQSEDIARLVPPAGKDATRVKEFLTALSAGVERNENRDGTLVAGNVATMPSGSAGSLRQERRNLIRGAVSNLGALPWYAWLALVALLPVAGLTVMAVGTARRKHSLRNTANEPVPAIGGPELITGSIDLEKIKAEGPPFPHPVIDPVLCIGCHACVEACPHDVLTIVNGIATPAALDQCMEDTSCQVECPTNPKACIVINTNKVIPPRKVPSRGQKLMTNVDGIFMIGDVSGVPLIKNAVNEGAQVVDYVIEDLETESSNPNTQYDVAIVGIGPAGLSAAVIAKQRRLTYVALEQDKVVNTIQNYPAGKYVFYKPDTLEAKGGIPLPGAGEKREQLLNAWISAMTSNGVVIQEEESCVGVKREDGVFVVTTEKGRLKQKTNYRVRRVILAIGNRGTPMKLRVPGEEIKLVIQPEPVPAKHCPRCGAARRGPHTTCTGCGFQLPVTKPAPYEDSKVKYKLTDPDDYAGKKCIVVGAGNSAIEAAVDLVGFTRESDRFAFIRNNEVTLVIRSDFKGDLKLRNKMNVYDCIDAGRIKVCFRAEIKEIKENEVVLMDTRTKEETARITNDYVFAMIGGERPTKFLESIGIKIG